MKMQSEESAKAKAKARIVRLGMQSLVDDTLVAFCLAKLQLNDWIDLHDCSVAYVGEHSDEKFATVATTFCQYRGFVKVSSPVADAAASAAAPSNTLEQMMSMLALQTQSMQELRTQLAPLPTIAEGVRSLSDAQHAALEMTSVKASRASSTKMQSVLQRLGIEFEDTEIPCCLEQGAMQMPTDVDPATVWGESGANTEAIATPLSRDYLQNVVCDDDDLSNVRVLEVQLVTWLQLCDLQRRVTISPCNTDLVFILWTSDSERHLRQHVTESKRNEAEWMKVTDPETLHRLLPFMIAAFELKTPKEMMTNLSKCIAQAVMEALCFRKHGIIDVPVILGDLVRYCVVHMAASQPVDTAASKPAHTADSNPEVIHVAGARAATAKVEEEVEQARKAAVAYIRALLKANRARLLAPKAPRVPDGGDGGSGSQGGGAAHGDEGLEREGSEREGAERSGDKQSGDDFVSGGDPASHLSDAYAVSGSLQEFDEDMVEAENRFHLDVYAALQHPRIYEGFGFSEPPAIEHKSLYEIWHSKRVRI